MINPVLTPVDENKTAQCTCKINRSVFVLVFQFSSISHSVFNGRVCTFNIGSANLPFAFESIRIESQMELGIKIQIRISNPIFSTPTNINF